MKDRTARGTALVNLINLAQEERIQAIIDTRTYEDGAYLFFATKHGTVKKTKMTEYDSSVRNGLIAINLARGDELVRVVQTTGKNDIVMVTHERPDDPVRRDRCARRWAVPSAGVRGMKLREGDAVVACDVYRRGAVMLFVSSSGHGKRTKLDLFHRQGRGGQGVRGMKITAATGRCRRSLLRDRRRRDPGVLVGRQYHSHAGAQEISLQGRDATGVRVARLGEGETIVAVAPVLEAEAAERTALTPR